MKMKQEGGYLIRAGIIGLGQHSLENLIPSILELENFQLTGISSRSLQKAKQYASRYRIDVATDNWTKIVDPSIVDAIVVAAPPDLHAEIISLCLEKGIHVFVEKPPAPDIRTLQILTEKAEKKPNIVTFVDYNFRFGSTFRKVVDIVRKESEPQCAKIKMISSKPLKPFWGWSSLPRTFLFAVGIHAIEMACNLLGPFSKVSAQVCWISKEKMVIELELQNSKGKAVFIELGNYSNKFEYTLELFGSSGIVAILNQHNSITTYNTQIQPVMPEVFEGKETIKYVWPSLHGGYEVTGYKNALKTFSESIISGTESISPISSSLPVYQILEEVLRQIDFNRLI
jgi:predicted dehydrogenase